LDLKNKKLRKLKATWTFESEKDMRIQHGMPWPTREIEKPQRKTGFTKSIWRAVYDELFYRWQMRKWDKIGEGVESEIAAALANEIAQEIDKEILADIAKVIGVPKDQLGKNNE